MTNHTIPAAELRRIATWQERQDEDVKEGFIQLQAAYMQAEITELRAYAEAQEVTMLALLDRVEEQSAENARLKAVLSRCNAGTVRDAERYRWLRDGQSTYSGYAGTAPFVMDPSASRLFAVAKLRGEALDVTLDNDRLETKAQELHVANEVVERGLLPVGARRSNSDDDYVRALYALAQKELGFTDEQVAAIAAAQEGSKNG